MANGNDNQDAAKIIELCADEQKFRQFTIVRLLQLSKDVTDTKAVVQGINSDGCSKFADHKTGLSVKQTSGLVALLLAAAEIARGIISR